MTDERRAVAALGIGGLLAAGVTVAGLRFALTAQPGDPSVPWFWGLAALGALVAPALMLPPARAWTTLRHRQVVELYLLDAALLTVLSWAVTFTWGLLSVLLYAVPPLCAARVWVHGTRAALRWPAVFLCLLALAAPGVQAVQNRVAALEMPADGDWMTPVVTAPGTLPGAYVAADGGTRELLHYPVPAAGRIPMEGDPWDPAAAVAVVTVHRGGDEQCGRLRVPVTADTGGQMTPPSLVLVVVHDAPHDLGHQLTACGDPADPDGYELRHQGVVITLSGGPGAPPHDPPAGYLTDDAPPARSSAALDARRRSLLTGIRHAHRATDADLRARSGRLPHTLLGWLLM